MEYGLYWQCGLWNMIISSSASRLLNNRSTALYLCCKALRIFIVKFVPKQDLPSKTYDHTLERAAREALFSFCRQWAHLSIPWIHFAMLRSCTPLIHALWTTPGKHFAHLGPNWLHRNRIKLVEARSCSEISASIARCKVKTGKFHIYICATLNRLQSRSLATSPSNFPWKHIGNSKSAKAA